MNDNDLICSICGDPIEQEQRTQWRFGHNAEPVNSGRCCSDCNALVVLPARIAQMYGLTNASMSKK